MISEATLAFERLPIIENATIIRNILYSGVWTKYEMIKKKRMEGRKSVSYTHLYGKKWSCTWW